MSGRPPGSHFLPFFTSFYPGWRLGYGPKGNTARKVRNWQERGKRCEAEGS